MATGKERQRQLAREHYERQMARRAERLAKARRRRIIGSTVAAVVVAAGVAATALVVVNGSGGETNASASPLAEPKAFDAATGTCGYAADTQGEVKDAGLPPAQADNKTPKTMTLDTNHGKIEIELDVAKAPCTANSFAHLAGKDFFDGSKCHRLVTGGLHVLQCGDPLAKGDGKNPTDGAGGPGYRVPDENLGGMPYKRGVVAMANSGSPHSGGSQFFIIYGDDTNNLQPSYTPFGTVTKGMDIVDKVAKAGVQGGGSDGAPKLAVELKDVTISGKS